MADGQVIGTHFLVEHNVSFDECGSLFAMIGTAVKGFALADKQTQARLVLVGVTDEMDDEFRVVLNQVIKADYAMKKLGGLKGRMP